MTGLVRAALVAGVATALAGCPGDSLECVTFQPTCTPLYQPTWERVYQNTFAPKCGVGEGTCHSGATAPGGLQLDDADLAFQHLLRADRTYVLAGDPSCSEIVERMRTDSSRLLMPRGSRLSDAEICAVEQWIAAGAPGPVALDAGVDATVPGP